MPDDAPHPPPAPWLLPLPAPVWAVLAALAGLEAAFWLGAQGLIGGPAAAGWRLVLAEHIGVSAPLQAWMIETRQAPLEHLLRYLGYPLIHAGPLQAGLSAVFIAALGKAVGGWLGAVRLAAVLVVPAAAGAAVFGLLAPPPGLLLGAMPVVFALLGAWAVERRTRAALGVVGVFVVLRLAVGVWIEPGAVWIAELAAGALGAGLAALLAPGVPGRVLVWLRAR